MKHMKLWILRPVDFDSDVDLTNGRFTYDCNFGFVVRAETEARARQLVNMRASDEGHVWENIKITTCVELTQDGKESIIINDFHAG